MKSIRTLLAFVTALGAVMAAMMVGTSVAWAAPSPSLSNQASASAPAAAGLSSQDEAWLKGAHQVNLEEVKGGTVAQQKGTTATVRSIGRTLASDHRMFDTKLTALANGLSVSLPSSPSGEQRAELARVGAMSGSAFDRAFVQAEITGHKMAISQTQTEISQGSSPQVVRLARTALPVLQKHLSLLQRAAAQLPPSKVPTGNGGQAALMASLSHGVAYALVGIGLVLVFVTSGVGLARRRR